MIKKVKIANFRSINSLYNLKEISHDKKNPRIISNSNL